MLLLKNSFRALKENRVKTIGIIMLVLLACFLFSLFGNAVAVLQQSNDEYFEQQNVYDFTILPKVDEPDNSSAEVTKSYEQKLQKLAAENDFYYEVQKTALYDFEKDDKEYIFLLIVPQQQINKPYLLAGKLPENDNEVTVSDQYARENNLQIGDSFDINGDKFTITGFAYQPDFVYPVMDEEAPDVVAAEQSVVFVTDQAINALDLEIRYNYSARFNDHNYSYNRVMALRDTLKDDVQYINSHNNKINRSRTAYLEEQINNLTIFSYCFLIFMVLVIGFALTSILHKKAEADKQKLGQLKAMGYNNFEIAISYLALALTASVTGGMLGYGGGYFAARAVVNYFTAAIIQLPVSFPGISLWWLLAATAISLAVLSLISFISALTVIKRPTLELIYENRAERVNALSKRVAVWCSKRSFQTQFKFAVITKSPLRFVGAFLIMLAICVMLMVSLIVSKMVQANVDAKVNQVGYGYEIAYDEEVDISDIHSDGYYEPAFNLRLYVKAGITANGQILNYDALNNNEDALNDFYVDALAIEPDSRLLKITDSNSGELINSRLQGDEIGISAVIAQLLAVSTGDRIVFFDAKGTEKTYTVIAISEDYGQADIYIALATLQNDFGKQDKINIIYTAGAYHDEELDYVAVAGKEEINSFRQEGVLPTILTTAFAVILILISFIMLLILANIIIDENRKSISLLTVLGYTVKEISYMVVDVYTPIIVVAYLTALPVAISVCRQFTNVMAQNSYISYPVAISPLLFAAGGLGLYLSYQIAIRATRRNIKSEAWRKDVY